MSLDLQSSSTHVRTSRSRCSHDAFRRSSKAQRVGKDAQTPPDWTGPSNCCVLVFEGVAAVT